MPLPKSNFFKALLAAKPNSPAIVGPGQNATTTYADLLRHVNSVQESLKAIRSEDRVAILVDKGLGYPAAFLGVWAAGGIAVPVCTSHPTPEMLYTLQDSGSKVLIVSERFAKRGSELQQKIPKLQLIHVENVLDSGSKDQPRLSDGQFDENTGALIIYTSGTTGQPKGAVHTHKSTVAQVTSLKEAWKYGPEDRLLHVLPLHHIHGIVNALLTPLYSASCVEFAPEKFDAEGVWQRLLSSTNPITLFMAVPTIYTKLLSAVPKGDVKLKDVRLCVSGSAALPTSVKKSWKEHTGHVLLERYGMTEIGMGLSCGMAEEDRLDSSVGWPLPGIRAKLVDEETHREIGGDDVPGEIWISGDNLFREYLNKKAQTEKEIVHEQGVRWFKTGDIALRSKDHRGAYFIQGRSSVDIIKSGGYKISALEVERDILHLPFVKEAAVMGVKDDEWGQRVAALIVPAEGHEGLTLKELREALKEEIAGYKVPTLMKVLRDGIPRNAMGKVNKKELVKEFDKSDGKASKL
ncbi:putative Peroxisomal AMP binding enzyme [Taphrina deformans PYCC 5710]|uniref:Peroxisomal AMP binding enzyme n=1 Tax=Taphrina deformans (strain PYCC 5710 / ATCC 11124 / CBS 356.35 / IMI 108563 / JCM 9778 / NBRC 8474) TaxID=1097556 RepID=R4XHE3_TAPDE|nr:putative Peroxisomal AMP binding enzyme [Taphrina deformans PYCC 5710]|eukprot:CCG82832.1 putative Peroxisomal AMP binding enzyme [Taphrina deformans PYCC 5710]